MNVDIQTEEKRFVEDVGLLFERTGMPRMAGRILGRLLISYPPHQSTDELSEALMASKGSISTMTRLLIQFGFIERLTLPGIRHDYFRIRPGAWHHMMKQTTEEIKLARELTERGVRLAAGKSDLTRQWLEEMRDMYAFFEKEWPSLLERWEQVRKNRSLPAT